MEKYARKELIGSGGFAKVYKTIDTHTSKEYAMKVIDTSLMQNKNCDNEIALLQSISHLSHPNIVKYETSFRDEVNRRCVIIMEYCKGKILIKMYRR
jgi:serine/threonine protein kinase